MEAIAGRRSRRFCMGAEILDGVLSFKSKHKPLPLSEVGILRHARYAPKLSNYCGSPVGRTFPSAAGFITSEIFFTDYFFTDYPLSFVFILTHIC
jgi:hypothetical protein